MNERGWTLRELACGRMRGPAAAIAVPAAVSLFSAVMAKMSADKQAKALTSGLTPGSEEFAARRGAVDTAGSLAEGSQPLLALGTQATGRGAGYYSSLLGSRAAQTAATAPAAEGIRSTYAGAQRGLTGRDPGASARTADSDRLMTGQISRLTQGVQPMAASALANIGGQAAGQGLSGLGGAGGIYGNLAANLGAARLGTTGAMSGILQNQSASNQQTGQGLMGVLQSFMQNKGSKPGGGGGGAGGGGSIIGMPVSR